MFYRGKIIHVKTCHDYHSVGGGKLSTDKHETCICDCVPVIEKKINHGKTFTFFFPCESVIAKKKSIHG